MTDPIADMLTRIRNAYRAGRPETVVPFSGIKKSLAELLVSEKYLMGVEKIDVESLPWSPRTSRRFAKRGRSDLLRLVLRYDTSGRPAVQSLDRVSKPSRRVYVSKSDTPIIRSGLGITVISTSKGLMTGRQAQKAGLGGEVICSIY